MAEYPKEYMIDAEKRTFIVFNLGGLTRFINSIACSVELLSGNNLAVVVSLTLPMPAGAPGV